jgi:hypothetical protein
MKIDLNFKSVFYRAGRSFVDGLQKRVMGQVGIDGAGYSRPNQSTLEARNPQTKKVRVSEKKAIFKRIKSSSISRLLVTGRFARGAFGMRATGDGLSVFVREAKHSEGVSFGDIVRYNSRGQEEVNPHIQFPPLVFPTTPQEVLMMREEIYELSKELKIAINRDIGNSGIIKDRVFKVG